MAVARPRRATAAKTGAHGFLPIFPIPNLDFSRSGEHRRARPGFSACRQGARATPLLHARRTAFVIDTLTGANFSASGSRGTAAIYRAVVGVESGSNLWIGFAAMQMRAIHPKTARREEKSDKKKEERIGAQLMAEINEPTDITATATISDTWKPSSSHLQLTWALPLTAWREQRHALDDVQIHTAGAGIHTSVGGYGNEAARASSHLTLPQQTAERAAAAQSGCEQHASNRIQRGATYGRGATGRPLPPPPLRILSVCLYAR